jgi:hypothetical protein
MLNDSVLKVSPKGSFKVTQLCQSVAICEALKEEQPEAALRERHNWGNATETEPDGHLTGVNAIHAPCPPFIAYLGCSEAEISGYLKTINTFYRCSWSEIRKSKYLKNFEAEIKIRGMQRYADTHAFGLDYLVESETAKHIGCDFDEYNYYTTGYQPRW